MRLIKETLDCAALGRPVFVYRKMRRRTFVVSVRSTGDVCVRVGLSTPQSEIFDLVLRHRDWIEKHLRRARIEDQPVANGVLVSVLGLPTAIELQFDSKIQFQGEVLLDGESPRIRLLAPTCLAESALDETTQILLRRALRATIRAFAEPWILSRMQHWVERTGLMPSKIQLREPSTLWGSCSSRAVISLNWKMIVFSPNLIDYILVHELCHLKHFDHSQKFWELLSSYCCDVKSSRKAITTQHHLTHYLKKPNRPV